MTTPIIPEDTLKGLRAEMDAKIAAAADAHKNAIVAAVNKAIKDSIEANKATMSAELTIGHKKGWVKDWLTILAPAATSIAVVILGFAIWNQQTKITQNLSKEEKTFAARLSLREAYIKRKFDAYEKINENITTLAAAVDANAALASIETKKKLTDVLVDLDMVSKSQKLYISDDVDTEAGEVWKTGIAFSQEGKAEQQLSVLDKISGLKNKMKKEMEQIEIDSGLSTPTPAQGNSNANGG